MANYEQPRYVPRVIELLRHDHWQVQLAALDALIRLNADVPSEALEPLAQKHSEGAIILLARDVKRNGPLLMISDETW